MKDRSLEMNRGGVPRRIAIIGNSGAGKTTLARTLAQRLGLAHVELDALYHERGWTAASLETFRERTVRAVAVEAWVADGNYSQVRDLVWGQADTLLWLDYPLPFILARLTRRTFRRLRTREELWNGNREEWRNHFLSTDSLFLWAIKVHRRRRREYPQHLKRPEYTHLRVLRFRTAGQTQTWLDALPEYAATPSLPSP
jgi:adenylate kinase family enzyme